MKFYNNTGPVRNYTFTRLANGADVIVDLLQVTSVEEIEVEDDSGRKHLAARLTGGSESGRVVVIDRDRSAKSLVESARIAATGPTAPKFSGLKE